MVQGQITIIAIRRKTQIRKWEMKKKISNFNIQVIFTNYESQCQLKERKKQLQRQSQANFTYFQCLL